jgi:hypothetical protein
MQRPSGVLGDEPRGVKGHHSRGIRRPVLGVL